MDEIPIAPLAAEVRLKRFLHFGSENPLYLPGDRFFQNCFLQKNLTAIESMLIDSPPDKHGDAVNHIVKAFMDGYSGYPECLIFALAVCAQQKASEKLRSLAYDAVRTVCKTPRDLFLFVNFTTQLSSPTKGFGKGWRKAITDWYLNKEPLELAECVSRFRGHFGWTHRDLWKLSHIKSSNKTKSAILMYGMKGLDAVKSDESLNSEQTPELTEVLNYLQVIEDFKHESDLHSCARLIEIHNLTIDHVPSHNKFINSADVWLALVPRMPLSDLLNNIIRLSCLGFLRQDHTLVSHVIDRLTDQTALVESSLHPTQVYIALRNYEEHAKNQHDLMERLVKQGKINKTIKPAPKPNAKIVEALQKLLLSTFKLLFPTGMRYLIALDLSHNMIMWKCNTCKNVKPAHAAILLALCLLQAERAVTVVTFPALPGPPPEEELIDPQNAVVHHVNRRGKSKKGSSVLPPKSELRPMVEVELDVQLDIQQNLDKVKEAPVGPVEVAQPIIWAQKTQKPVDVFILVTDYVTKRKREFIEPFVALRKYREEMKLPNAKLVTCALVSNTLDVAHPNDRGMLDVCGFDGKMARIIEAFCRGAF